MARKNPHREQFDFDGYEEYARRLSNDQLHYSIQDALRALDVARTWDDGGAGEAKYLDQLSVLRRERDARRARQNPMVSDGYDDAQYADYARSLSDKQLHQELVNVVYTLSERPEGSREIEARCHRQIAILTRERDARRARQNPEWAEKIGSAVYRGTRYAAEVGQDLYRGAKAAHGARKNPSLSTCARQYLETALRTTISQNGKTFDRLFRISDFAPEAIEKADQDCQSFMDNNDVGDLEYEEIGHNFWLTRNHHGTGFWDLGLNEYLGKQLTEAAHAYGETDVYVGDDGKLYLS